MIGSGKSEYARRRAAGGALVVCRDDLCRMLHAGALGGCGYEPASRERYRRMESALVREVLAAGRDAVIDRTHLTRESRGRWVALAHGLGAGAIAVVFPVESPEVHARRRFEADARGRSLDDWLAVARHHAAQAAAEPISVDEGFAEIRYVERR
jgi:predicted kinase